jgi:DNA-binding phage protein
VPRWPWRNVCVTLINVTAPRTAAERYLAGRLQDPEYRRAYQSVRDRVSGIDAVMRALDARREELAISKAELARRAGVKPEAVRRLFSAERPNPTLITVLALADALELDVVPMPRRAGTAGDRGSGPVTPSRSGTDGTRLRTS